MQPHRRKYIPLATQLHAALIQLGLEPHECQLDHDPALELRVWDEAANDTVPPANDPHFLIWRPTAEHRRKTSGRHGESKLSIRDGDVQKIAKTRRLEKKQAEYRARLLAKETGKPTPKKSGWPSRPFSTRSNKRRSS